MRIETRRALLLYFERIRTLSGVRFALRGLKHIDDQNEDQNMIAPVFLEDYDIPSEGFERIATFAVA